VIEPNYQPIFDAPAYRLIKRALRRRFHAIYARDLDRVTRLEPDRPVIICPNHTNWWDGFLARLLSPYLPEHKPRRRLMQQEKFLQNARFFTMMGVYGIDLENPLPSLRFSMKLLRDPRVQLWMFPQGHLVPQWKPVEARRGVELLARETHAQVLPLIFRYEWTIESRPTIFVKSGPVLPPERFSTKILQRTMRDLYDQLAPDIEQLNYHAFQTLMPPQMSINKRFEYFLHLLRRPGSKFDRHNR
jgi:1-acyl-sn-glycerol-3-phosphate acyltransferase